MVDSWSSVEGKKQVTIYRSRAITRRLVGVIAVAKVHAVYFFALL